MFRFALHALIVLILTLLTQIGGIAYLVALAASRAWGLRRFLAELAIFLLCYAGATFAAGLAAPIFGRVPLSCIADAADRLVVRSPIYCLLNRNYVTPEVHDLAKALTAHMDREFPGRAGCEFPLHERLSAAAASVACRREKARLRLLLQE